MKGVDEVLDYWFGEIGADGDVVEDRAWLWWEKNPQVDEEIEREFEGTLQAAAAGELEEWQGTARGQLALIILLDQMTRNMYRGTAQMFAYDAQALWLSQEGIAKGYDAQLPLIQRVFFYMPLEHAEDDRAQEMSVAKFAALAAEKPSFAHYLDYAHKHKVIIDRFGRYPHRNEILGRETTAEEAAFLTQPNSSF